MEYDEYELEKITKLVVVSLAVGVLGFIFTVATVALLGPSIQDIFKGLPWGVG